MALGDASAIAGQQGMPAHLLLDSGQQLTGFRFAAGEQACVIFLAHAPELAIDLAPAAQQTGQSIHVGALALGKFPGNIIHVQGYEKALFCFPAHESAPAAARCARGDGKCLRW